jgi:hypothetical protein
MNAVIPENACLQGPATVYFASRVFNDGKSR